jgi:hypothetical protein
VHCVSDYCQILWHMYSGIRSEARRPDVKWHLYILPGDFLYQVPCWVNRCELPVVFRMKMKISKSRISLLTSGIICLNLLKNKIFRIKIIFASQGLRFGFPFSPPLADLEYALIFHWLRLPVHVSNQKTFYTEHMLLTKCKQRCHFPFWFQWKHLSRLPKLWNFSLGWQ